MKKSLLFLLPVAALLISGCGKRPRPVDPSTSSQPTTSATTGTTGGTSATSSSSGTTSEDPSTSETSSTSETPIEPTHAGSKEDPFDATDAALVGKKLAKSTASEKHPSEQKYYISGKVTVLTECSAQFGNATFEFGEGESRFVCYRLKVGESQAKVPSDDYIKKDYKVTVYTDIINWQDEYAESNDGYIVSVSAKEIKSIAVKTAPTKVSYYVDQVFDPTGLVLTVTYEDDTTEEVPYAGNEDKFSFAPALDAKLTVDDKKVTITYETFKCEQAITVANVALESIVVSGDLEKKSYTLGDEWDPAGLTATGHYSDGKDDDITSSVSWEYTPAKPALDTTTVSVVAVSGTLKSAAKAVEGITVKEKSALQVAYEVAAALASNVESDKEYTFSGVVTGVSGNSFYLQDGDYGMYVYNKETAGIAVGKIVEVTSKVKNYSGLIETSNPSKSEVKGDGNLPAAVKVASVAALNKLNCNILVDIEEAVFVSKTADWADSGKNMRADFTVGSETITVAQDKFAYVKANADLVNNAKVGDKFKFTNFISSIYDSKVPNQLAITGSSTIEDAIPPVEPTEIHIDALPSNEVFVGGQVALSATVGPEGAPQNVDWKIESGESFASLDGSTLTGVAPGSVVVKATVTGHSDLFDTVTITVKETEKTLISSITPTPASLMLRLGDDPAEINIAVAPAQYDEDVVWSISSGNDFITLNETTHKISPVAVGKAVVRIEGSISHVGCNVDVDVRAAVTPIAEVYAAAIAANGSETSVYTFAGVVTAIQGNSFFVQEDGHGMLVYNHAVANNAVGKVVEVVSTVYAYSKNASDENKLPETKTVTSATIIGEADVPTPINLASKSDIGEANVLASAYNAELKSKGTAWTDKVAGIYTFAIGSDNVEVKFDKYGYNADKANLVNNATVGDVFNLTNIVTTIGNNAKQLNFAGTSSIEKVEKIVEGISINGNPDKVNYYDGDSFNPAGLILNVSYKGESGTTEVAYNSGTASKFSFDKTILHVGDSKVTVTFGGYTADIGISVSAVELSSITLNTDNVTKSFVKDSQFSYAGLVVTAHYNNGSESVVTPTSVSAPDMSTTGQKTVTVSYTEGTITKTNTYTITVQASDVPVTSVSLDVTELELEIGGTHQFVASILPTDATNKSVTWNLVEPSVENIATIDEDGLFTAEKTGTVTVRVTTTSGSKTADCEVTISEPGGDKSFQKVTNLTDLTNGKYLIVCESESVAFNGGLTGTVEKPLDISENTVSVTASEGEIAYTEALENATFTYDSSNGSLKSASGYYIGQNADSNGMLNSLTTPYVNTFSFDEEYNINVAGENGARLRYNKAANQLRFRYYKSSTYTAQQAIQIYKLVD